MGSKRKEMDFVFDTTSDWLAVEGHKCKDCTGNVFDASQSEFSKKVGTEESERQYNEIIVSGSEWEDQVCLNNQCVEDFEYFLINKQTFLKEPIDGFLGLARTEPFITGSLRNSNYERGPSYVRALQEAGLIGRDAFSVYLSAKDDGQNFIHFGEPDEKLVKNPDAFANIKLTDDLFWSSGCQGFGFGDLGNNFQIPDLQTKFIRNNEVYSIFDTGSAHIQIPKELYPAYLKQLYFESDIEDIEP